MSGADHDRGRPDTFRDKPVPTVCAVGAGATIALSFRGATNVPFTVCSLSIADVLFFGSV
jgi:hypothetical protein